MAARFYVALTAAQLEAVKEAMGARLAGPVEEADQRQETYEAAETALHRAVRAEIAVFLSLAEGRGLCALASEGAEALLTDASAARGYIGGSGAVAAAERAQQKLEVAVGRT